MERKKYFDATEHENIREILYASAEKYGERTAFILKHKENKDVKYENISYKRSKCTRNKILSTRVQRQKNSDSWKKQIWMGINTLSKPIRGNG